jgi:hypothetical protein
MQPIIKCSAPMQWSGVADLLYDFRYEPTITIDYSAEGGLQHRGTDFFSWVHNQCRKVGVDPSKIELYWGNLNTADLYSEWCKRFNPAVPFRKAAYMDKWAQVTVNFQRDYSEHALYKGIRPKIFSALMGFPREHRAETLNYIHRNNLSDKAEWTWLSDSRLNNALDPNIPIPTSIEGNIKSYLDIFVTKPSHDSFYKVFDNTYFDVVTETFYLHDLNFHSEYDWWESVFLSEKTWRCMTNKRPFVLIGNRNALAQLHKLGFKTFPHLFDESYDSLPDSERISAALEQVKNFANSEEVHGIYSCKKTTEILEHNYAHIIKLTRDS